MRALVFNQYMNALGGGERYAFAFADALRASFDVDVAGPVVPDPADLARLGFSVPAPIREMSIRDFPAASRSYDLTFQLANHRPLASRAPRSVVMVQFPYPPFHWKHPVRYRPRRWRSDEVYITNSEFSRSWCGPRWGVDAEVISPPVELGPGRAAVGDKQPRILAVGRFFRGHHDKRFDVLVRAYAGLPAGLRDTWELVLAGGTRERSARAVVDDLRAMSRGLNVRLVTDAGRAELLDLYRESALFWQATGWERSPRHPERAEHFGIALVEAMSHGCVPLVYADGGAPEILARLDYGLWRSLDDLRRLSAQLVDDDQTRAELAGRAADAAAGYSYAAFDQRVVDLLRRRFGVG